MARKPHSLESASNRVKSRLFQALTRIHALTQTQNLRICFLHRKTRNLTRLQQQIRRKRKGMGFVASSGFSPTIQHQSLLDARKQLVIK